MAEEINVEKLSKICARLASPHDGERAAAALIATQILEDFDMRWDDLIIKAFQGKEKPQSSRFDSRVSGWHVSYCQHVLDNYFEDLNEWQIGFLQNLCGKFQHSCLTEKQAAKLEEILDLFKIKVRT
jgi:hypothetical protein